MEDSKLGLKCHLQPLPPFQNAFSQVLVGANCSLNAKYHTTSNIQFCPRSTPTFSISFSLISHQLKVMFWKVNQWFFHNWLKKKQTLIFFFFFHWTPYCLVTINSQSWLKQKHTDVGKLYMVHPSQSALKDITKEVFSLDTIHFPKRWSTFFQCSPKHCLPFWVLTVALWEHLQQAKSGQRNWLAKHLGSSHIHVNAVLPDLWDIKSELRYSFQK